MQKKVKKKKKNESLSSDLTQEQTIFSEDFVRENLIILVVLDPD